MNSNLAESYIFFIEQSPTPIYQRIIESLKRALTESGHKVVSSHPSQFKDYTEYIRYVASQKLDYCIITNGFCTLSSYCESSQAFLFELIDIPVIFIHHDNIFSNIYDSEKIRLKLEAFCRIRARSFHFCIEYHNFLDLKSLGIENTYTISHASEFEFLGFPESYSYDVSFVGHVLPELGSAFEEIPYSHFLKADFWNRLTQLDKKLEQSAISFATCIDSNQGNIIDFLVAKYVYISMLHLHSPFFRGELIKKIEDKNIHIFGGDPAYLHGMELKREIQKPNIFYHPATKEYSSTKYIYKNSKINLNITSLQFDDALTNRVVDVGAVGGFILTDWKSALKSITSVYEEISFKTIEELNYKIDYYLTHEEERLEIASTLHQDVIKNCNYYQVVSFILSKIESMKTTQADPLRLDLGCGGWKTEGFVGVDIYSGPGVDVVADLNRRFPFPDNSVDEIKAHDVLEHLKDNIHSMNEIWRICKPYAKVDIRVPSTDGRGAFQDPTHVSFWNLNSFRYYCVEFPAYIELCRSYGLQGAFKILSLTQEESSDQVVHVRAVLEVIKSLDNELASERDAPDWNLREITFLIFPNWNEPEELLAQDLSTVLRAIADHNDKGFMSLLIHTGNLTHEEAELVISAVAMELFLQEDLDINEGPEISFFNNLNQVKTQTPLEKAHFRIPLNCEDQQLIKSSELDLSDIPISELSDFSNRRVISSEAGTWNFQ